MKILALIPAFVLVGCACGPAATPAATYPSAAPAYAAPCAPRSAAVYATPTVGNCYAPQYGAPQAVVEANAYSVAFGAPGGREYMKSALMIPAGVTECLTTGAAEGLVVVGRTARCVVNALFPPVEPSTRFVPAYVGNAPAYYAAPPPAAAPRCP